jgi:hypothetical protein
VLLSNLIEVEVEVEKDITEEFENLPNEELDKNFVEILH